MRVFVFGMAQQRICRGLLLYLVDSSSRSVYGSQGLSHVAMHSFYAVFSVKDTTGHQQVDEYQSQLFVSAYRNSTFTFSSLLCWAATLVDSVTHVCSVSVR